MSNTAANIFIGNDYEELRGKLFSNLQGEILPLKKIIVTPSPLLENEFINGVTSNTSLFGFKVMQLYSAVDYLLRLLKLDDTLKFKLPTPTLLAFHIECILRKIKKNEKELDSKTEELLRPVLDFFENSHDMLFNKRVKELSFELSKAFQVLGCYGALELERFLSEETWQKYIWDKVYSHWSYLYLLEQIKEIPNQHEFEASFHFFGFSHIPYVIDRFLMKLPKEVKVTYYNLSPSLFYYGDMLADKKRFKISKHLSAEKKASFEEYTESPNSLLSNWGKVFSERQNFYSDQLLKIEELYIDPETKTEASFETSIRSENTTLLDHIKSDLLYMEFPEGKTSCDNLDYSFQVHSAKTKHREVENLKNVVLNLIEKEGLQPKDIAIYAPDISKYYPYLSMIFEEESPKLAMHVEGLSIFDQSPYLIALMELFSLRLTRFSKIDVLKIFHHKAVKDCVKLSKEEISYIDNLCEKAQIRFGFNKKHKEDLLSKFSKKSFIGSDIGSWEYGLQKLILGTCIYLDESVSSEGIESYFPIPGLDFTQSLAFGRFIKYIYNLFEDLQTFSNRQLCIEKWCEKIIAFAEKYLSVDEDAGETGSYSLLIDQLKVLSKLGVYLEDQKLPFSSIESFLKKAFSKKTSKSDAQTNKIFVSSLSLGALKSFKTICLLGMDESYPRVEKSMKLLPFEKSNMDAFPNAQEEDKHLLLESLIMAQKFYVVSYTSVSNEDGKEVYISSAFEQVLALLDDHYTIKGEKISKARVFEQSLLSFDQKYFEKSYPFKLYSQHLYSKAEKYYFTEKKDNAFIDEFYRPIEISKEDSKIDVIPITQLRNLLSNPIGFYFKYTLGIFLKEKESEKDLLEKELFIPPLEKYFLKRDLLNQNQDDVIQHARNRGVIPEGIYKELAQNELFEYEGELSSLCENFQIGMGDFWTFKVSPEFESVFVDEVSQIGYFPSPEIEIDGKKVKFCGEISSITKKGLFFKGKDKIPDLVKIWPEYLLFVLIEKPIEFESCLLIGKSNSIKQMSRKEAKEAFFEFIRYFFLSLKHPSPMHPSIAEAILRGASSDLEKEIAKMFSKGTKHFDQYTQWSVDHMKPLCSETIEKNWTKILKKSFLKLLEW